MMTIPGYQQIEKLYQSDTAFVVRAEQMETGQPVVLKLLRPDSQTQEAQAGLRREFNIGMRLKAGGIIDFHGFEISLNGAMIVQEDFGGTSLDRVLGPSPPHLGQALELSVKITDALRQIHQFGVTHKDINPSNIVWNRQTGQLKIIDFGIASELPREYQDIKHPNAMKGTPAYMSPEQTGYMNRPLDYRSDFYSLGVTLYEIFTGTLPFQMEDILELLHCHIAHPPIRPEKHNPDIPEIISAIIVKLLSKHPEDRYRTAAGLKKDLEYCLHHCLSDKTIPRFPIGKHDTTDRFQISGQRYGRQEEKEALSAFFDSVRHGEKKIVIVTGQKGSGKSMLVRELQKPTLAHQGFFISGKCDPLKQNTPFHAMSQAMGQHVAYLLAGNEAQRTLWQKKVSNALGANGRMIVDLVHELEQLIGPQTKIEESLSYTVQHHFSHVFQNFIRVFLRKGRPMVLFLDNLQWADPALIELIERVMGNKSLDNLLIVGALCEDGINDDHPVMKAMASIQKNGQPVHRLRLGPLALSDVQNLLARTFHMDLDPILPLAEAVHTKARGNPLFTHLLLQDLFEKKKVLFNKEKGAWAWDTDETITPSLTDDMMDLITAKVKRLPEQTLETLKRASCMGFFTDSKTLSIACQKSKDETLKNLWEAMKQDLVYATHTCSLPSFTHLQGTGDVDGNIVFHFLQERIQQAVYGLIPDDKKQTAHHEIGRFLAGSLPQTRCSTTIFNIVDHLNIAGGIVKSPGEHKLTAELNLNAGRQAMATNAWESAHIYLNHARQMMTDRHWETAHPLMLELYIQSANAAFLSGHFSEMEDIISQGIGNAGNFLDTISFYETRLQCFFSRNRLMDMIKEGLHILDELGHRFPSRPEKRHAIIEFLTIRWLMLGRTIDSLYKTPNIHDKNIHNAFRILPYIGSASYRACPKLLPLVVFRGVKLFLKHGNAAESAFFMAAYAMILCNPLDRIDIGSRIGDLSLSLNERPIARRFKVRTAYLVEGFVRHWKHHIRETLSPLMESYHLGMETGDIEYGNCSIHLHCAYRFLAGDLLADVIPDVTDFGRAMEYHKQVNVLNYNIILHQALLNFVQPEGDPIRLCGRVYDEDDMLPLHRNANDATALYVVYYYKMMLACTFERWEDAVANAEQAGIYDDFSVGLFYVPCRMFYEALARFVVLPTRSSAEKKRFTKRIRHIVNSLKIWTGHAPMNHRHRYLLLCAETERIKRRFDCAADLYDQAIRNAKENLFRQDEALFLERYANFWFERNKPEIGRLYLKKAMEAYRIWGATEKVRRISLKYPDKRSYIKELKIPGPLKDIHQSGQVNLLEETIKSPGLSKSLAHEMRNVLSDTQKLLKKLFSTDDGTRKTLSHRNTLILNDIYRILEEHLEPSRLDAITGKISLINENACTVDDVLTRTEAQIRQAIALIDEAMDSNPDIS